MRRAVRVRRIGVCGPDRGTVRHGPLHTRPHVNGNPGIPVRSEATKVGVLLLVKQGIPKTLAAQRLGISRTAFFQWRRDDPDFEAELDRATADFGSVLLEKAFAIAEGEGRESAQMIQWLLERRFFQFFSRKERVNTGNANGDPDEEVLIASTGEPAPEAIAERVRTIHRLLEGAGVGEQPVHAEDDAVHTA